MQKRSLERTYHKVPEFRLILLRFCAHTIPNINGVVFVAFFLTFYTPHGEMASACSARNCAQDTEMGAMSVSRGTLAIYTGQCSQGPRGMRLFMPSLDHIGLDMAPRGAVGQTGDRNQR
jgi:hypothetical protein